MMEIKEVGQSGQVCRDEKAMEEEEEVVVVLLQHAFAISSPSS